jgi:hypothetical protein
MCFGNHFRAETGVESTRGLVSGEYNSVIKYSKASERVVLETFTLA